MQHYLSYSHVPGSDLLIKFLNWGKNRGYVLVFYFILACKN